MKIRYAKPEDLARLTKIDNYYIANSHATFFVEPRKAEARRGFSKYKELFSLLKSEPLHLAVAGIALPNEASIALHKKFGFEEVGVFKEYAIKNGKYISSIWMQKRMGQ
jgi:phosphinothricin acetyltransferase